jgi:hypothetical protein
MDLVDEINRKLSQLNGICTRRIRRPMPGTAAFCGHLYGRRVHIVEAMRGGTRMIKRTFNLTIDIDRLGDKVKEIG